MIYIAILLVVAVAVIAIVVAVRAIRARQMGLLIGQEEARRDSIIDGYPHDDAPGGHR